MKLLNVEVAVNVVFSPQKQFLSGPVSDRCHRYRTVSVDLLLALSTSNLCFHYLQKCLSRTSNARECVHSSGAWKKTAVDSGKWAAPIGCR